MDLVGAIFGAPQTATKTATLLAASPKIQADKAKDSEDVEVKSETQWVFWAVPPAVCPMF